MKDETLKKVRGAQQQAIVRAMAKRDAKMMAKILLEALREGQPMGQRAHASVFAETVEHWIEIELEFVEELRGCAEVMRGALGEQPN